VRTWRGRTRRCEESRAFFFRCSVAEGACSTVAFVELSLRFRESRIESDKAEKPFFFSRIGRNKSSNFCLSLTQKLLVAICPLKLPRLPPHLLPPELPTTAASSCFFFFNPFA
jgi:hypothetical protein